MNNATNADKGYFDDFDFDNAKTIKHPLIKKLQDTAKSQTLPFDDDVTDWLFKQDKNTQRHINDMIRHLMAMKPA